MAPRPEVTRFVASQSGRGGIKPRLIVLHTTEGHDRPGVEDLRGLGEFFNGAPASSHVANDQEGNDARYVPDSRKAWTQSNANPYSLSVEQIGFASFTRKEWVEQRMPQLRNTAEWVAYWSQLYGIPIRESTLRGVCQHSQLGAWGGGHHDCGGGYPFDLVLAMAQGIDPQAAKLKRWREELRRRRAQMAHATGGTRMFVVRRIGELKRAINRTKGKR